MQNFRLSAEYARAFVKWIVLSIIVGLVGGVIGSLFHICVDYATELRTSHSWLIYLLPIGGLAITAIYSVFKNKGNLDTNRVLEAATEEEKVPLVMAPLIFISTVITHLLGGSAGREGAALQLGGSIGYNIGSAFKLNKNDVHTLVMSGMSAVFSALFGTPVTAAIFAIEVLRVGEMHYGALVPCVVSSIVAYFTAGSFGISPVRFSGISISIDAPVELGMIVILAILCAIVSILFCLAIKYCESYSERFIKNNYIRAFVGGGVIVLLTVIFNTYDYNGAGMDIISKAMSGDAKYEAFIIKIVFTAITIAAGFRGGEIVPSFFIGSTFGCVAGYLLGIDTGFAAAVGFVAVFCGVVNCPIASLILALEVFGSENIMIFALVCAISYMMSGYFGLYKSQKFVYSKLSEEHIDR
ncbi:MAG: chloride channel protein [Clostridia bacterium]|nr:chloride channel protein [Clostridia bacterium]